MKTNIIIYSFLAVYFLVVGTLYVVWHTNTYDGEIEWAGTLAIFGCAVLGGFFVAWLTMNFRKQGGALLEDTEEADIDDADPELGEFSPWSWWPLLLGFGIAVVTLGLCIGKMFWLAFYGAPLVLLGVVGLIYEYYRGNFAR